MNKPNLKLDWCGSDAAKYACEKWHYSGCVPNAGVKIGVWEDGEFVGVVLYGIGAGASTNGKRYGLAPQREIAELVRVALSGKQKTPTSRIVSISIKMVKRMNPNLRMLISFADEMGQGHHGGIYQAMNWVYTGTFTGVCGYIVNGKKCHLRTLTGKNQPPIPCGAIPIETKKHRYLYPFDSEIKQRVEKFKQPYPKRVRSIDGDATGHQPDEGGSIPTLTLSSKAVLDV